MTVVRHRCEKCGGECGHTSRVYRRGLYTRSVTALRALLDAGPGYHHLPTVYPTKDGGDPAKMEHWGLVVRDKRRAGWWKVTEKGNAFAAGILTVPAAVFLLDNKPVGWSSEHVQVHQVAHKVFDLREI